MQGDNIVLLIPSYPAFIFKRIDFFVAFKSTPNFKLFGKNARMRNKRKIAENIKLIFFEIGNIKKRTDMVICALPDKFAVFGGIYFFFSAFSEPAFCEHFKHFLRSYSARFHLLCKKLNRHRMAVNKVNNLFNGYFIFFAKTFAVILIKNSIDIAACGDSADFNLRRIEVSKIQSCGYYLFAVERLNGFKIRVFLCVIVINYKQRALITKLIELSELSFIILGKLFALKHFNISNRNILIVGNKHNKIRNIRCKNYCIVAVFITVGIVFDKLALADAAHTADKKQIILLKLAVDFLNFRISSDKEALDRRER